MTKKEFKIIVCVAVFFVLPHMHALLSNLKPIIVDWFVFSTKSQDIQWYIKDSLDYLSLISLSIAIILLLPLKLKPFGIALIINNTLKLPLYWLFYLQFDWAINITIFSIFYIKYLTYEKRNNTRAGS